MEGLPIPLLLVQLPQWRGSGGRPPQSGSGDKLRIFSGQIRSHFRLISAWSRGARWTNPSPVFGQTTQCWLGPQQAGDCDAGAGLSGSTWHSSAPPGHLNSHISVAPRGPGDSHFDGSGKYQGKMFFWFPDNFPSHWTGLYLYHNSPLLPGDQFAFDLNILAQRSCQIHSLSDFYD